MGYAQLYIKPKGKTRLQTLKEEYNILIRTQKTLVGYLDNVLVLCEIRSRKISEFKKLCGKLNNTLMQIQREDCKMTHEEIISGFTNNTNIKNITRKQGVVI